MGRAKPKYRRGRAVRPPRAMSGSEAAAPEISERPDATFVDDPRPARATPDSLDDASATAVDAGIEGVRDADARRDQSP